MAKFRRSIQPIGFRPEEVSERNVSELQAYSNRIINALKEERDAVITNRNEISNAMEKNAQIESQQLSRDKAIQQNNIDVQLKAQQDLSDRALKEFETRTKVTQQLFGTVADLSLTASKKLREIEVKRLEEKDKAVAAEIMIMGDNHPAVKALKALKYDAQIEELDGRVKIAQAREMGADPIQADEALKRLNELGYHSKAAILRHIGKGFYSYLAEQSIAKPESFKDPARFTSEALAEYEAIHGISGQLAALKQETGYLDSVFKVSQSFIDTATRRKLDDNKQTILEDFRFKLRQASGNSADTKGIVEMHFPTLVSVLGREEAHKVMEETLSEINSDGSFPVNLEGVAAAEVGPNKEAWGVRWANRLERAKAARVRGFSSTVSAGESQKQALAIQLYNELEPALEQQLASGSPQDDLSIFATFKAQIYEKAGYYPPRLIERERQILQENRQQSEEKANLLRNKIRTGQATVGEIMSIEDPMLRAEIMKEHQKAVYQTNFGENYEESLKSVEAAAKQIMGDSLEGGASYEAKRLNAVMQKNFAEDYKKGLQLYKDPDRALQYAEDRLQRDKDAALINQDKNARYYSVVGPNNRKVFKNVEALKARTSAQQNEALNTLRQTLKSGGLNTLNSPGLLGTETELRVLSDANRTGQVLKFTPQIKEAAKILGITELEAANEAINAFNQYNTTKIAPLTLDPTLQSVNNSRPETRALFFNNPSVERIMRGAAEIQQTPLRDPNNMRSSFRGGREGLPATVSAGEGGWNSVNRGRAGDTPGGSRSVLGQDLTQLSFGDVEKMQSNNRVFAVGAYQFTPGVLARARREAGLPANAPMTPENQTKAFWGLALGDTSKPASQAKRPKLAAYLRGTSNDLDGAHRELSMEWAGVVGPDGRGYYDGDSAGNRASVGAQRVREALIAARKKLSGK